MGLYLWLAVREALFLGGVVVFVVTSHEIWAVCFLAVYLVILVASYGSMGSQTKKEY